MAAITVTARSITALGMGIMRISPNGGRKKTPCGARWVRRERVCAAGLLRVSLAEPAPEEIGGTNQVGDDERLQGQGQDGNHGGHGAELDCTCADDGGCEEGEEHGDSFRGCAADE